MEDTNSPHTAPQITGRSARGIRDAAALATDDRMRAATALAAAHDYRIEAHESAADCWDVRIYSTRKTYDTRGPYHRLRDIRCRDIPRTVLTQVAEYAADLEWRTARKLTFEDAAELLEAIHDHQQTGVEGFTVAPDHEVYAHGIATGWTLRHGPKTGWTLRRPTGKVCGAGDITLHEITRAHTFLIVRDMRARGLAPASWG